MSSVDAQHSGKEILSKFEIIYAALVARVRQPSAQTLVHVMDGIACRRLTTLGDEHRVMPVHQGAAFRWNDMRG